MKREVSKIRDEAYQNRVVIYTQAGCPYCKKGVAFVKKCAGDDTTMVIRDGTVMKMRLALQEATNQPSVTFPIIVIGGVYHGGADDVLALGEAEVRSVIASAADGDESKTVTPLLQSSPMAWAGHVQKKRRLDLLRPPTGPRGVLFGWKQGFHIKVWANVIRLLSFFHVLLLASCLVLRAYHMPGVATAILWFLLVDISFFVLHGAHPIAPLATLTTAILWKRKGPAVEIFPYKVVFFVYILGLVRELMVVDGTKESQNVIVLSMLTNSSFLAVLRF